MLWLPRMLALAFVGFLFLFSLDVYQPGMGIGELLVGMLMHNIPSIVLLIVISLAWNHEIIGALGFFGAGLAYIGLVFSNVIGGDLQWYIAISWSMTIAGPAFLVGWLYWRNWQIRKKKT